MEKIKKAVVLAAGFGTRLRPLTFTLPKPLLPVWNEPMLERILKMLENWGVEEIAVNAHWKAEKVRAYIARRQSKANIIVSEEPEILGTGGVLNPLRTFIGNDSFWLVNGDIVVENVKQEPILKAFEASGNFAACLISEYQGPRTIEADPEGRVCNWKSDFPGDHGTYTYCGCAVVSSDIFHYLQPSGFSSIVFAYEEAMMKDAKFVVGVAQEDSFWGDAGTLESYLEIHAALNQEKFEENPNVIFEGVKLLPSADLAGCVVTGGLIGGAFSRTAIVGVAQMDDPKLKAITEKLGWKLEDTAAQFIGERGSDRSFWRLICGDERAVAVVYDDAKRPENARYAEHSKLLSEAGVPVAKVLADIPEMKILAIEDLGCESIETHLQKHKKNLVKLYTPVVQAIAKMHTSGTEAVLAKDAKLEPSFGEDLYKWERDLFETYAVKERFGYDALPAEVAKELEGVALELCRQRPVLVHRDFQSSNVLLRKDGSFGFIDFQGMRLGAAAYDLASLLYDPYVEIDEATRKSLAKVYREAVPELANGVNVLALAAVQRLVQALGAFGRLASVGQPGFMKHISRALQNLLEAADEADLDAVGAFAEELIARENVIEGRFFR